MRTTKATSLLVGLLLLAGCTGDDPGVVQAQDCSLQTNLLVSGGVAKDAIPALTDPPLVEAAAATYLDDDSRVIGIVVDGQAIAVPHVILWNHEIVNFDFPDRPLAVTYCPLTGSSMVFDRTAVGGAGFGVSGLLYQNNLTMYDRNDRESLWPQMDRRAGCGARDETPLPMVAAAEMTWAGWRGLHPDTRILSSATGSGFPYGPSRYPYGDYEREDNERLIFPMPIDPRRPPKERVLGIPDGQGGLAFPFGALDGLGSLGAVNHVVGPTPVVVFWDREKRGALAFERTVTGQSGPLTFEVDGDQLVDAQTGSTWTFDGRATTGPLVGTELSPVPEAFVAFWFAWEFFYPDTQLWAP